MRAVTKSLVTLTSIGVIAAGSIALAPAGSSTPCQVTSLTDDSSSTPGSLRFAISNATPGDTICFDSNLFVGGPATMTLAFGEILLAKELTIQGPGSGQLTIDASGSSRVFNIFFDPTRPGAVAIRGLTAAHGTSGAAVGGAIQSYNANVTLSDITVSDSTATNFGAGILLASGGTAAGVHLSHTLSHVTFSRNTVTYVGGPSSGGGGLAVYGDSADNLPDAISIADSTFSNNATVSGGSGAGLLLRHVAANVTNLQFDGNSAAQWGGGVMVGEASTLSATRLTFTNNVSIFGGGAINFDGDLAGSSIRTSEFSGNHSGGGGAIHARGPSSGTFLIDSSLFVGNYATTAGVLDIDLPTTGGTFLVRNTTMTDNWAANYGGAITQETFGSVSPLIVQFCTITNNRTGHELGGGGIMSWSGATISHSVISGNTQKTEGVTVPSDLVAASGAHPVSVNYSLIGRRIGYTTGAGNLPDGTAPQLGTLAANGGPMRTVMPRPQSPLINGGVRTLGGAPATDGRGLARKVGDRYDIGAVEVRATNAPRLLTGTLGASGSRKVTLRWAAPTTGDSFTYVVQRRIGTGAWVTLTSTLASSNLSYVASGLVAGKSYGFRVGSLNKLGYGTFSAVVTKTAR